MEWIFLLGIEGCISFLIKDFIPNIDILSIIFIIINTVFISIYLANKLESKKILYIIMSGVLLRILFIFIDYYIIKLPHSGSDTEAFHREALYIYNNIEYFKAALMGNYAKFLGIFYTIFGPQRLLAQYINTILEVVIFVTLIDIFNLIKIKKKTIINICILMCFFPHNIIFSSILLREKFVEVFLVLSIKYLVRWILEYRYKDAIFSIIYILIGSLFHSGIITLIIIYIVIFSVYYVPNNTIRISCKSMGIIVSVCIPSILLLLIYPDVFLDKFPDIKNLESMVTSMNPTVIGGSSYLTNLKIDSLPKLILFSPIKMIYFIISPMVWDIRGAFDIIAFLLDSLVYIYILSYLLIKKINIIDLQKKQVFKILTLCLIMLIFTFALGVSNTGTALRHRCKIFPIILILFSISLDGCKNKSKNVEDVNE